MDYENNSYLIERLRNGDEEAYVFLLDKYHRILYAYAISLIEDRDLAQDIVQNVFVRTWQYRDKLNSKYSIKSFLLKSTYNEFINSYRKNKAVTILEEKYLEALSEVSEDIDEMRLKKVIAKVMAEIKNLPPKCRRIFMLSKKEGLTNQEISEHLDISVKTVEAQITKAFGILRTKLKTDSSGFLFLLFGIEMIQTSNSIPATLLPREN